MVDELRQFQIAIQFWSLLKVNKMSRFFSSRRSKILGKLVLKNGMNEDVV